METGIYRHNGGGLFFVEGEGSFFDPRQADQPAVFLRNLKNGRRCCVLAKNFNQETKRFDLVQDIPVEKMQMLLPGTRVAFSEKGPECKVVSVLERESKIFVQVDTKVEYQAPEVLLDMFLQKAFLLETF